MFSTRLNPTKPPAAHRAVLERVGAACRELRPIEEACFSNERLNHEIAAIFAKHGVLGVGIDPEFGGVGTDPLLCVLAAERIGREGFGPSSFFVAHTALAAASIARGGTVDQKKRYLPRAARGECVLGFAFGDPRGPDAATATTFEETSDGFLLNGTKQGANNTDLAGAMVILARRRSGDFGITYSTFVVDTDIPGLHVVASPGQPILPSGSLGGVSFDGCKVSQDSRLGDASQLLGGGLQITGSGLLNSRLLIAAASIGVIADCLEIMSQSLAAQFSTSQSDEIPDQVNHHVAQTAADLEAVRALVYAAAELKAECDRHPDSKHLGLETDTFLSEAEYSARRAVKHMRSRATQIDMAGITLFDTLPARHRLVPWATVFSKESADHLAPMIARYYLFL